MPFCAAPMILGPTMQYGSGPCNSASSASDSRASHLRACLGIRGLSASPKLAVIGRTKGIAMGGLSCMPFGGCDRRLLIC